MLVVTVPCELLVKLRALRWDHCPEITGWELTVIWDLNLTIKEERQTFAYRPKRKKSYNKATRSYSCVTTSQGTTVVPRC